ncbi:MlaD family protein [Robiginitalea marina]|uniref:MlaD family protein n=1 Tax=Robiginitalea marina TaxID=2954105 RepID=A0ABT1AYZ4_9FLAO|nr:MlaD family protein [Robiginitalea marina]MCO5725156.1 MlaD family protein [Robiginitalea marina]
MATTTSQYVRLGFFVIAGSLLLLAMAYLIGNDQNIFRPTFRITSVFKNVNGLQEGNNVRYSGINVGTVEAIVMENDTSIRVTMAIGEDMLRHIKGNAIAMVGSDGLVGSMLINILPGEGPGQPIRDGDEISSFSRITTQDMLTTLNVTNENAALLTEDLLEVTRALRKGSGVLGKLLNDSLLAGDLKESFHNLKISTDQSRQAVTRLNHMIGQWRLEESALTLLMDDPAFADQLRGVAARLDSSGREINDLTQRLNGLVGGLQDGEGTLGLLLRDTAMAAEIRHGLKHLDSGLVKFDQNMEALQHNFLTRGYFRKLERERERERRAEEKNR